MPHITGHSRIDWQFHIQGEGEVVVFLHGWGVDHRIWRQQIKHFSTCFKVVAIDLPGHGKTSWKRADMDEMADDIDKIFRHLEFNNICLVGSSLGGIFALKIYERDPDRVKKISFVGSMPKFSRSDDYPYGLNIAEMHKLAGQLNTAYPSIVNIFFRSLFTAEERKSRRFKWLQKFRARDEVPMKQALSEYLDILEKEDVRSVLKSVDKPVQFINGEGDQICPITWLEYLKTICPSARVDIFEQCGHFPFLSKPHEFNQILADFLMQADHGVSTDR